MLGLVVGCGGGGGGPPTFPFTQGGVDVAVQVGQIDVVDRTFDAGHCAVVEGAVGGTGLRRLMRFDTVIVNHGTEDLIIGPPDDPFLPLTTADFEWSPCHGHYHFSGWSDYRLEDDVGGLVAVGHKEAFCLEDTVDVSGQQLPSHGFSCSDQGITSGWADIYHHVLDGQWVDVTGVAEGDYWLVVTVNDAGKIPEIDVQPNFVRVRVHVPDPNEPPPGGMGP